MEPTNTTEETNEAVEQILTKDIRDIDDTDELDAHTTDHIGAVPGSTDYVRIAWTSGYLTEYVAENDGDVRVKFFDDSYDLINDFKVEDNAPIDVARHDAEVVPEFITGGMPEGALFGYTGGDV
jgi:hypothetical protein